MRKKVLSLILLWAALLALALIYTDRDEYTWRSVGAVGMTGSVGATGIVGSVGLYGLTVLRTFGCGAAVFFM